MDWRTGSTVVECNDLDTAIDDYTTRLGYRLDMITPADAPREALMSKDGERLRVRVTPLGVQSDERLNASLLPSDWIRGRAGMEYRDLIPGRLDGKLIASHIRLTKGGEVADYVHYHKVRFQMIYCLKGRIKVIYEDQGPPFWLETGDCVLQPPEIRHRVLEATAGAEVVEVGIPAVHETWVEHEISLPTATLAPGRDFGGQRFVRHIAADSPWIATGISGLSARNTEILSATDGFANVRVLRADAGCDFRSNLYGDFSIHFLFVIAGQVRLHLAGGRRHKADCGQAIILETASVEKIEAVEAADWLFVSLKL